MFNELIGQTTFCYKNKHMERFLPKVHYVFLKLVWTLSNDHIILHSMWY